MKKFLLLLPAICVGLSLLAQKKPSFTGMDMNMGTLSKIAPGAQTRSISPENFSGAKGRAAMAELKDSTKSNVANASREARELGRGWKLNPYINIKAGETFTIAEMEGPGAIQHIWMTPTGNWRYSIIRFYWDDETEPSIEVPVGDFFCMGWGVFSPLNSLAVTVNPGSAFNCYWKMPFRKKCRITMENIQPYESMRLYYQVDYVLAPVDEEEGYLHAQFRRSNPNMTSDHVILDGVKGEGQYVGTYMAFGTKNNKWWGEGEIKFFMDGDKEFPTIAGTGTEDYFCGSYNFENRRLKTGYQEFSTAYAGFHQVNKPDGLYNSQMTFGMYRWHILDPIRFTKDLRVTIQDLGWRNGNTYLAQKSDIATVAFWYQREPHARFPKLDVKTLELN